MTPLPRALPVELQRAAIISHAGWKDSRVYNMWMFTSLNSSGACREGEIHNKQRILYIWVQNNCIQCGELMRLMINNMWWAQHTVSNNSIWYKTSVRQMCVGPDPIGSCLFKWGISEWRQTRGSKRSWGRKLHLRWPLGVRRSMTSLYP